MISARTATAAATALISILILTSSLLAQAPDTSRYWAQWRGPHASGVSSTANPPVEWSETRNIRSNSGILNALDAGTGAPHYQNQRLEGVPNVFASPVSRGAASISPAARAPRW